MSAYIIAIGGTGAKFVESVVHLTAAGLIDKDLHVLFVDPDKGNGNLDRAAEALKNYTNCSKAIVGPINGQIKWMQNKIVNGGSWSPFDKTREGEGGKKNLASFFRYVKYKEDDPVRHLFDVLYTEEEKKAPLEEGFRGRPAIGSAVISKLGRELHEHRPWADLIAGITGDANQGGRDRGKVFLCGSIFGGTGASGFSTLGRLLWEALGPDGINILSSTDLGGLLMLPYFGFQASGSDQIYADAAEFSLRTEVALRYYEAKGLKINPVYLLGTPDLESLEKFSTGGSTQCNLPHFIELFGGLGLRDFLSKKAEDMPRTERTIIRLDRHNPDSIDWEDIPDKRDVQKKLANSVRFAFAWLSVVMPDLEFAKKNPNGVNWAKKFFSKAELNAKLPDDWDKVENIGKWCKDYLVWVYNLHQAKNTKVGLFNASCFAHLARNDSNQNAELDRSKFPDLVSGIKGKEIGRVLTPQAMKLESSDSDNKGASGLAKALYNSISKNH